MQSKMMDKKQLLLTILLPLSLIGLLASPYAEAKVPIIHYQDECECYVTSSLPEAIAAINKQNPPRNVNVEWIDGPAYVTARTHRGRPSFGNLSLDSLLNGGLFSDEVFKSVANQANPLDVWNKMDKSIGPFTSMLNGGKGLGNLTGGTTGQGNSTAAPATQTTKASQQTMMPQDVMEQTANAASSFVNGFVGLIGSLSPFDAEIMGER